MLQTRRYGGIHASILLAIVLACCCHTLCSAEDREDIFITSLLDARRIFDGTLINPGNILFDLNCSDAGIYVMSKVENVDGNILLQMASTCSCDATFYLVFPDMKNVSGNIELDDVDATVVFISPAMKKAVKLSVKQHTCGTSVFLGMSSFPTSAGIPADVMGRVASSETSTSIEIEDVQLESASQGSMPHVLIDNLEADEIVLTVLDNLNVTSIIELNMLTNSSLNEFSLELSATSVVTLAVDEIGEVDINIAQSPSDARLTIKPSQQGGGTCKIASFGITCADNEFQADTMVYLVDAVVSLDEPAPSCVTVGSAIYTNTTTVATTVTTTTTGKDEDDDDDEEEDTIEDDGAIEDENDSTTTIDPAMTTTTKTSRTYTLEFAFDLDFPSLTQQLRDELTEAILVAMSTGVSAVSRGEIIGISLRDGSTIAAVSFATNNALQQAQQKVDSANGQLKISYQNSVLSGHVYDTTVSTTTTTPTTSDDGSITPPALDIVFQIEYLTLTDERKERLKNDIIADLTTGPFAVQRDEILDVTFSQGSTIATVTFASNTAADNAKQTVDNGDVVVPNEGSSVVGRRLNPASGKSSTDQKLYIFLITGLVLVLVAIGAVARKKIRRNHTAPGDLELVTMNDYQMEALFRQHVVQGDCKQVTECLRLKPEIVDVKDSLGLTALMIAAMQCDAKMIKILLSHNANVSASDNRNRAAMHHLCIAVDKYGEPVEKGKATEALKVLMTALPCLDQQDDQGHSVAMSLTRSAHPELCMSIIKECTPNSLALKDDQGMTILHHCVVSEVQPNILNEVARKITPDQLNTQDNQGKTAIQWAVALENAALVDALVSRKRVNLDVTDKHNENCLHTAAKTGNVVIASLLLSARWPSLIMSLLFAKDRNGHVSWEIASARGHEECVTLLQETQERLSQTSSKTSSPASSPAALSPKDPTSCDGGSTSGDKKPRKQRAKRKVGVKEHLQAEVAFLEEEHEELKNKVAAARAEASLLGTMVAPVDESSVMDEDLGYLDVSTMGFGDLLTDNSMAQDASSPYGNIPPVEDHLLLPMLDAHSMKDLQWNCP